MIKEAGLSVAGMALTTFVPVAQDSLEAVGKIPSNIEETVRYGLGYALVFMLLVPMMKWVMRTMTSAQKERDQLLREMVGSLRLAVTAMSDANNEFKAFQKEEVRVHTQLMDRLNDISAILNSIDKK